MNKDEKAGWGGPRRAGKGKRMGRPRLMGSENMRHHDVRVPAEWVGPITNYGGGRFSEGVRKILVESGVVK
jgi:hypothetical protein